MITEIDSITKQCLEYSIQLLWRKIKTSKEFQKRISLRNLGKGNQIASLLLNSLYLLRWLWNNPSFITIKCFNSLLSQCGMTWKIHIQFFLKMQTYTSPKYTSICFYLEKEIRKITLDFPLLQTYWKYKSVWFPTEAILLFWRFSQRCKWHF